MVVGTAGVQGQKSILPTTPKRGGTWHSLRGRAREMGLGSLSKVSLADARDERDKCNRLLRDHHDPIEHRKRQRTEAALADAATITFKEAAAAYCAAHRAGLKTAKYAAQWVSTLSTYAEPAIGNLAVRDINTSHIHRVLDPIWSVKLTDVMLKRVGVEERGKRTAVATLEQRKLVSVARRANRNPLVTVHFFE